MSTLAPHSHGAGPDAGPSQPARRGRRWWVYVLWVFGALFLLVVTAVVSLALYWNSLIKNYTSLQPKPVPTIEGVEEKFVDLKGRWDPYALQFLHPDRTIAPFELSGEDLNVFASRFGPFRKHAFVEILENRLRVQFSVPLDLTKNPRLAGRFLNGVAVLNPELAHGGINLRLVSVEANGKPIPGWILRRLQQANLAEALNRRPEFDLAVRALERIEFQPDRLVLQPRPPGR